MLTCLILSLCLVITTATRAQGELSKRRGSPEIWITLSTDHNEFPLLQAWPDAFTCLQRKEQQVFGTLSNKREYQCFIGGDYILHTCPDIVPASQELPIFAIIASEEAITKKTGVNQNTKTCQSTVEFYLERDVTVWERITSRNNSFLRQYILSGVSVLISFLLLLPIFRCKSLSTGEINQLITSYLKKIAKNCIRSIRKLLDGKKVVGTKRKGNRQKSRRARNFRSDIIDDEVYY